MYGVGSSPLPAVTTGDCLVMESSSRYPHIHHLPPPTHIKLQENKKQEAREFRMLLLLLQPSSCYLGVLTESQIMKKANQMERSQFVVKGEMPRSGI